MNRPWLHSLALLSLPLSAAETTYHLKPLDRKPGQVITIRLSNPVAKR